LAQGHRSQPLPLGPVLAASVPMTRVAVATALALAAVAPLANARGAKRGFLSLEANMQPEVVAKTLMNVEEQWRSEATAFAECNQTNGRSESCSDDPSKFRKSCATIVSAVLQASNGNRGVVQEYMTEVCAQDQLKGWRSDLCQVFSEAVATAMTEDNYANREELDAGGVCRQFWESFASEESARVQKERAEREAAEQRVAAEQKVAADKAAKAAEAAAAAQRLQEAKKKAELAAEAKRQAEEAAKKLSEPDAHQEEEVKQKMAEAQADVDGTPKVQASLNVTAAANASKLVADAATAQPNVTSSAPANATRMASTSGNATETADRNATEPVSLQAALPTQNATKPVIMVANKSS